MTELFLKKDGGDWQQVYFATQGSGFKLTRENPYFTDSESYTLDVSLPMGIFQNRQFFGNLQRIDASKKSAKYQCRLMVGNKSMLDGTARVSQVIQDTVKVQLLGGNSELNFLSKESGAYIDEMDLGLINLFFIIDYKGQILDNSDSIVAFLPVYDETNSVVSNCKKYDKATGEWIGLLNATAGIVSAPQPNLLYILEAVLYKSGYTLQRCDIDCEPWNRLFIASAKGTSKLSHALPHWHVGEFLSELCKFFNCTISIDSNTKTASIISNAAFFNNTEKTNTLTPVDEYAADMDDENTSEALTSSNIEYDMSSSPEHVYDILSDEVRDTIPHKEYPSYDDASVDFAFMGEPECMRYLFICPTKIFIGAKDRDNDKIPVFKSEVDHFAPLRRNQESDNTISLKICPVALAYMDDALYYDGSNPDTPRMSCVVASMENPTGNEHPWDTTDNISAQDFIEGTETIGKAEKEDRLQVFFVDNKQQQSVIKSGSDKGKTVPFSMPFTDWGYISNMYIEHSPWSLAFSHTDATHYLGQLHNTGFSFNTKAKHTFKFIADKMPDPTKVFCIHGKLYGCEKIEANVKEKGFDRLMTGYFYEMI